MTLWQRMKDLDARRTSILPGTSEDRTAYLRRLASSGGGVVGPALRALATEVLDQRKTMADLRQRVEALEQGKR